MTRKQARNKTLQLVFLGVGCFVGLGMFVNWPAAVCVAMGFWASGINQDLERRKAKGENVSW